MQKLETALRILYFTLFLGKRYAVRYSLSVLAAGGGGAAAAPGQPCHLEDKPPVT